MAETPYPKLLPLPLLLLLLHFPFSASIIPIGSVLYAFGSNQNQSWSSPNDNFSVSFLPSSSPNSFLAAISFAGNVPIWSAGTVDSRGSLRLFPSGSLRLTNGSNTTVWDSGTDTLGVVSASIEDSGNFILLNSRNITVWSSFDHPTDTIVQSQNLTAGQLLRSGPYSFQLEKSGNLTLRWNNSTIYWNQELNSSNLSSPSLGLQTNGAVSIFDSTLRGGGGAETIYSDDYGEGNNNTFRFLKLDDDGNLRIYSSGIRNNGLVTSHWSALANQCLVYGYCGSFGICSYNDTNPICSCPSRNFDVIDVSDRRKGCKRKIELSDCSVSATMMTLDHTRLITNVDDDSVSFAGGSSCRSNCLANGSCVASVSTSDGSGNCWQKQPGSFFTGYQNSSVPSTSYIKVCGPVLLNRPLVPRRGGDGNSSRVELWIVAVAVVVGLVGLVVVEVCLWWCCCRKDSSFGALSPHYTLLEYASGAPVQFSYKELQRCTKTFKEKLGGGGFGVVYRGVLANRTVVAVKQLEGIEQGEKQFRMEVATISSTHHLNLVRLIGFCSEGRHRLLVYEFMRNGSLDSFLFNTDSGKLLTWEYRFNIALGTAKGITYLHEECRDCIVHCDIKPENILVDDNHTAKVSDFGLAKLLNPKDNRYNKNMSSVRGTRGYLAPEWLANLAVTSKSDVYSYGMVLLEIVSGRRNFDVSEKTNHKKFSIWAYDEFEKGNTEAVLDRRLAADQTVDMEQVRRMVQTSFWCIQEQPLQRPTMGKVVQMLEGITAMNKPPRPKTLSEASFSGNSVGTSHGSMLGGSGPTRSSSSSATRSFQTMGITSSGPASTRISEGSLLGSQGVVL